MSVFTMSAKTAPVSIITGEPSHLLSGVRNFVEPDVGKLALRMRTVVGEQAEQIRHDAPLTVARAAEWLLDNAVEVADVLMAMPVAVPYSRPMLLEAFENTTRRWMDPDRTAALVREESQAPHNSRAVFPQVVFHNLAGNLFVSGWESITYATLLGAASLIRCSEADRIFPSIWAFALSKFSALGTDVAAVCEWDRADFARLRTAAEASDAIVAFGGNDAVRAVREAAPWNRTFAGHGSAHSFAIVSGEELRHNPVEWLSEHCAYDFSLYDQQGCLSPRAIFVEDLHKRDVDRFVDALHGAMVNWSKLLPRRRLSLPDSAALARARDAVLLDAACGGPSRRVSADQDPFLITVKPCHQFTLGPVSRYVDVYLYKDVAEVEAALAPYAGQISTLGVVDPRRSVPGLVRMLRASRVCEIGQMQKPPLSWCLDGYRPLQKMLKFQSVQIR